MTAEKVIMTKVGLGPSEAQWFSVALMLARATMLV